MSDANKQSVERCKYRHNWVVTDGKIACSKCKSFPKASEFAQAEAILRLREWLKPGDVVYTQLQSVSRSGMSRVIDVRKIERRDGTEPDYSILSLGSNVALAIGSNYDRDRQGVKVSGCGMDMGFHLIYELSYVLFPDGFGEKCELCGWRPATKEEALGATGKNKTTSCPVKKPFRHQFHGRNGDKSGWDTDGGYALTQRWL